MKLKNVIPYFLFGSSALFSSEQSHAQLPDTYDMSALQLLSENIQKSSSQMALIASVDKNYTNMYSIDYCLDLKADDLCDTYMDNMISAQQRLQPLIGKRGYRAAVLRELPGAPVGFHCVYGQYVQLQRALDEMGDTMTIIPRTARSACVRFKSDMRKKYNEKNGYADCIFEGNVYPSDSAYNAALQKYLARNGITANSPAEKLDKYTNDFAGKNWSMESVKPGTMMIVPRTKGNKSKFHMIMLVGRGRISKGEFIPDSNGEWVYTGHNNERMGYFFRTWDTSDVFAADTHQIARINYQKELTRIDSMSLEDLIKFLALGNAATAAQLSCLPIRTLRKMARDKYLEKYIPAPNVPTRHTACVDNARTIDFWAAAKQHML